MRNDKLITKGKCFDLLSNSLNLFFNEMCRDQSGEIACKYLGLEGSKYFLHTVFDTFTLRLGNLFDKNDIKMIL